MRGALCWWCFCLPGKRVYFIWFLGLVLHEFFLPLGSMAFCSWTGGTFSALPLPLALPGREGLGALCFLEREDVFWGQSVGSVSEQNPSDSTASGSWIWSRGMT